MQKPSRRFSQPSGFVGIDQENDLCQKACFTWTPSSMADQARNVIGKRSGASPPTPGFHSKGVISNFKGGGGSNSYVDFGAHPGAFDLGRSGEHVTFAFLARNTAASWTNTGLAQRNDGNSVSAGWIVGFGFGGFSVLGYLHENSVANTRVGTNSVPALGAWFTFIVAHDGSTTAGNAKLYLDGILRTNDYTSNGSGTQGSDVANSLFIGDKNFDIAADWTGDISIVHIVKGRMWGDSQARAFHTNPFQVFRPQTSRIHVNVPAAGVVQPYPYLTVPQGQQQQPLLAQ